MLAKEVAKSCPAASLETTANWGVLTEVLLIGSPTELPIVLPIVWPKLDATPAPYSSVVITHSTTFRQLE